MRPRERNTNLETPRNHKCVLTCRPTSLSPTESFRVEGLSNRTALTIEDDQPHFNHLQLANQVCLPSRQPLPCNLPPGRSLMSEPPTIASRRLFLQSSAGA